MSIIKPNDLIAAAQQKTGLSDYAADEFQPFLERLCDSLNNEAQLSDAGAYTQTQRLTDIIAGRMQVEDYYRRHPEIDDEEIAPPLVITGLPRTGSTLLQRLIANDKRFLSVLFWESRFPAPFSGETLTDPSGRVDAAVAEVAMMLEAVPELAAVHPLDAMAADEEISLLEQSLCSTSSQAFTNIPSFAQWQEQQDQAIGYRYLKKLLKFIQWQKRQRGDQGKRWILKTPHHLHCIDTLVEAFPGVQVIQTHRDPLKTIPSIASFTHFLYQLNSENTDPINVAKSWNDKWAKGLKNCTDFRQAHPEVDFLDIAFRNTVSDPLDVLAKVYDFCGLDLSEEVSESAKQFLANNDRGSRPPHHYTLEMFGLSNGQLESDYQFYRQQYEPYI